MRLLSLVTLLTAFIFPPQGCFADPDAFKIKVAVIDTGLDLKDPRFRNVLCEKGHRDFSKTNIQDYNGHGTHVAGLILTNATVKNYCILIVKYYSEFDTNEERNFAWLNSMRYAVEQGAKIVNISGGGSTFVPEEYHIIADHPWVTFVVAAGNDGEDLDATYFKYYPAAYRSANVVTVGNLDRSGRKNPNSNFGSYVDVWEVGTEVTSYLPCNPLRDWNQRCFGKMTGTSQATAVHTGKLVDQLVKAQSQSQGSK